MRPRTLRLSASSTDEIIRVGGVARALEPGNLRVRTDGPPHLDLAIARTFSRQPCGLDTLLDPLFDGLHPVERVRTSAAGTVRYARQQEQRDAVVGQAAYLLPHVLVVVNAALRRHLIVVPPVPDQKLSPLAEERLQIDVTSCKESVVHLVGPFDEF